MTELDGISVLMAINEEHNYYQDAIKSIINQSRKADEIIIVVNGPVRKQLIDKISQLTINHVPIDLVQLNIKFIECEIEQLALALNIGLNAANYRFIARMDSDDLAEPTRLEKQYQWITAHHLDLVASQVYFIDEKSQIIGQSKYLTQTQIQKKLPFSSPLCHPTLFYRRRFIIEVGGYNAGFKSEDYDLFLRLNRKKIAWAMMPEPLLKYRIHKGQSHVSRLAYAECCALAMRELMLSKSFIHFVALITHIFKALFLSPRKE